MTENDEELEKIFIYLGLDKVPDGRLQLKKDIMKRVIVLLYEWKYGNKTETVDKLSTRLCLSVRKMRENYFYPLISDKIIKELNNSNDWVFVGLPKGVNIKIEEPKEVTIEATHPKTLTELAKRLTEEQKEEIKLNQKKKEIIVCANCGKDITEQVEMEQFFQYHGLKFCNKKCYELFKKKEEQKQKEEALRKQIFGEKSGNTEHT